MSEFRRFDDEGVLVVAVVHRHRMRIVAIRRRREWMRRIVIDQIGIGAARRRQAVR